MGEAWRCGGGRGRGGGVREAREIIWEGGILEAEGDSGKGGSLGKGGGLRGRFGREGGSGKREGGGGEGIWGGAGVGVVGM